MTKKVIIADDVEAFREMHAIYVQDHFPGIQVDQVATAEELVERVLAGKYDLVLSDNNMGGGDDGLAALQRIRQAGNPVPFYIVSARASVAQAALRYGATGFFDKAEFGPESMGELEKHLV